MATASNGLVNYFTAFANGADAVPATGAQRRIVCKASGTWAEGDRITMTVLYNNTQYNVGVKTVTEANITFAIAFRNQVMLCADDRVYFSGLDEPTGWEERFAGYGYITTSGERGEALEAVALAPYAGKLAVFSRNNIQLWLPNPDSTQWQLVQSLENIGTCAPKSVVSYGELDVFFLSDSGLRSLRVREATDLVQVEDVGTPIDVLLQSEMSGEMLLTSGFGYYSVRDGRYNLFLGNKIYSFNYFPTAKVAAWTYSSSDARASGASSSSAIIPQYVAAKNGRLYILDMLETYSLSMFPGTSGYNATSVIVLPFFDVKSPATRKNFYALDIVGEGTWKVEVGDNPNDETSFRELVAALPLSTVSYARVPLGFHSTHATLRLTNNTNEEAVIVKVIWHYQPEDSR